MRVLCLTLLILSLVASGQKNYYIGKSREYIKGQYERRNLEMFEENKDWIALQSMTGWESDAYWFRADTCYMLTVVFEKRYEGRFVDYFKSIGMESVGKNIYYHPEWKMYAAVMGGGKGYRVINYYK